MSELILVYLSYEMGGDWDKINNALKKKLKINLSRLYDLHYRYKIITREKTITILSDKYPEEFRKLKNPPFVIWYSGNLKKLDTKNKTAIVGSSITPFVPNEILIEIGFDKNKLLLSTNFNVFVSINNEIVESNDSIIVLSEGIKSTSKQSLDNKLYISEYPSYVSGTEDNKKRSNELVASLANEMVYIDISKLLRDRFKRIYSDVISFVKQNTLIDQKEFSLYSIEAYQLIETFQKAGKEIYFTGTISYEERVGNHNNDYKVIGVDIAKFYKARDIIDKEIDEIVN